MKRQWRSAAAWAALTAAIVLLFGACAGPGAGATEHGGYVYPNETVPAETLPPAPEPLPPVQTLSCLDVPGEPVSLTDAGEGRVLVCCREYGAEDWEDGIQTMYLADAVNDVLLAQGQMSGAWESVLGVRRNGEVVTTDYDEGLLRFYDEELQLQRSVTLPEDVGVFDRAGDCLCAVENGTVVRRSLDDLEPTSVLTAPGAGITAVDGERNLLLLSCRSADDRTDWDFCLYDAERQQTLLQGKESWSGTDLIASGVAVSVEIPSEPDTEEGSDLRRLSVYDAASGALTACWSVPADCSLYTDAGTDDGFWVRYLWDDPDAVSARTETRLCRLTDGRYWDLTGELGETGSVLPVYLPEAELWALGTGVFSDDGFRTGLTVLCPSSAEYGGTLEEAPEEKPAPALHEAGELLAEQRARADALEQTYGLRILLGDEVLDMYDNGYYTLVSLTDPEYWSGAEQAAETANAALDTVEQALAVYPEGFFQTFRDFRGEGGLRIALVNRLLTNSGSFSAGGIQYTNGAWYNVVLDADDLWSWDNVHHELWHACESRISVTEPDTFSPDNWDVFNPEGFTYTEDFETYYEREDINDYLLGWTEDPWFQQTYSTVTPMEDRATLLAACFESYYDPESNGYDTAVEWICSYPHLRAKLAYMHDAVERVFGTEYWEMP